MTSSSVTSGWVGVRRDTTNSSKGLKMSEWTFSSKLKLLPGALPTEPTLLLLFFILRSCCQVSSGSCMYHWRTSQISLVEKCWSRAKYVPQSVFIGALGLPVNPSGAQHHKWPLFAPRAHDTLSSFPSSSGSLPVFSVQLSAAPLCACVPVFRGSPRLCTWASGVSQGSFLECKAFQRPKHLRIPELQWNSCKYSKG